MYRKCKETTDKLSEISKPITNVELPDSTKADINYYSTYWYLKLVYFSDISQEAYDNMLAELPMAILKLSDDDQICFATLMTDDTVKLETKLGKRYIDGEWTWAARYPKFIKAYPIVLSMFSELLSK